MAVLRLLAKSSRDPDRPQPAETLAGHLAVVGQVAHRLVERRGRLTLSALGLDSRDYGQLFAEAVVLGALLHDIGKANEQFQRMVRVRPRSPRLSGTRSWASGCLPRHLSCMTGSSAIPPRLCG